MSAYSLDLERLPEKWELVRQGDLRARDELVEGYLWLAKRMAYSQNVPPHIERDDLISWASRGLFEAVTRFDPSTSDGALHKHFIAYASQRIRGAILDGLKSPQTSWAPRGVWQKLKLQQAAEERVSQRTGRPATAQEVADELGVERSELVSLQRQVAITSPVDGEGDAIELLPAHDITDQTADELVLSERLASSLEALPDDLQALVFEAVILKRPLGSIAAERKVRIPEVRRDLAAAVDMLRTTVRSM